MFCVHHGSVYVELGGSVVEELLDIVQDNDAQERHNNVAGRVSKYPPNSSILVSRLYRNEDQEVEVRILIE